MLLIYELRARSCLSCNYLQEIFKKGYPTKIIKALPFFLFIFTSFATENILFIGNSYTGQIRKTVTELFKQHKVDANLKFINPGGKNLKFHFENKDTLEIIKTGNWDRIILQDQS